MKIKNGSPLGSVKDDFSFFTHRGYTIIPYFLVVNDMLFILFVSIGVSLIMDF